MKNKDYGEILEEIRSKLEKFNTREYPMFSNFQDKDLTILIPWTDYNTLVSEYKTKHFNESWIKSIEDDKLFRIKLKPWDIDKIYIAYGEDDG